MVCTWARFCRSATRLEASALHHSGLHGRSPLLRLQSDERLVALIRRGNHGAFEALVARYQSRLLAFCRHMLSSREDAEDVLQEVFAAAFNAMLADEREINVRPWLYRIARNRSLNHLRRTQAVGMDSMDIHLSEGGLTTADKVHKREEFRLLIADVQDLPETQRTALLLREIDALSYEQIAEAMETTVPSVKSLLVRARVSLAEAAEARLLSCDEVRIELGEVAEGLKRTTAPVRRHLRTCDRCTDFRKYLRSNNKALAALFPIGPLLLFKKLLVTHIGTTAAASGTGAAAAGAGTAGAGAALQVGFGTVASKLGAGLAAAAIVTAGAVEVQHATTKPGVETDRRGEGRAEARRCCSGRRRDRPAGRRRLRAAADHGHRRAQDHADRSVRQAGQGGAEGHRHGHRERHSGRQRHPGRHRHGHAGRRRSRSRRGPRRRHHRAADRHAGHRRAGLGHLHAARRAAHPAAGHRPGVRRRPDAAGPAARPDPLGHARAARDARGAARSGRHARAAGRVDADALAGAGRRDARSVADRLAPLRTILAAADHRLAPPGDRQWATSTPPVTPRRQPAPATTSDRTYGRSPV